MASDADAGLWEAMGPTEIKREEIILTAKIATGAFGTVYRGTCRGKTVAIKKLKFNVPQGEVESFKREVDILRLLFCLCVIFLPFLLLLLL